MPLPRFPFLAELSTFLALLIKKKREPGTAPSEFALRSGLLLEVADVLHERLDFIIAQRLAESFHLGFLPVLHSVLDGLRHGVVLQGFLDFGIRIILDSELLAHLGLALAIRSVALGATLFPVLFRVRRADSYGARNQERQAEYN